ncbi:MAG: porin family protein [Bacteroidota bacterium]
MLGNEHTNDEWDGKFVDRAWEQMRQQLDKEMPLAAEAPKPRTNRSYWMFLLLLLVGFGAGIGVSKYWSGSDGSERLPDGNSPVKEQLTPKQPFASVPETPAKQEVVLADLSPPKLPDKAPALKASRSDQPPATPPKTLLTNQKNAYDNKTTLTKQNTTSEAPTTTLVNSSLRSFKALKSVKKIPPLAENENAAVTQTEEASPAPQAAVQQTALLESRSPEELSSKPLTLPLAPSYDFASRWKVGFQMASIATTQFDFNGLAVGMLLEYRLDRRFSIQTGLNYRFLQLKKDDVFVTYTGDAADVLRDDASFDQQNFGNPPNVNSSLSKVENAFALFPIYSMDYLSMPVAMSYAPNRWLRVNVGMQIDRLLNIDARDWGGSRVEEYNQRYETAELSDESLSLISDGINKWNAAAVIGLTYQATERLGVSGRYNFGLVDFTKDSWWGVRQFDAHKYLECSVNFYF